jgi:fatty acid synthase
MLTDAPDEAIAAAEEKPASVKWPHGVLDTIEAGDFYLDVARAGIQYGPAFRMLRRASGDGAAAVLRRAPGVLSRLLPCSFPQH